MRYVNCGLYSNKFTCLICGLCSDRLKFRDTFLFSSSYTQLTIQGKIGSMYGLNMPKHVAYLTIYSY